MFNLITIEDLKAAVEAETRQQLKTLLADRLADTIHCGLQELTHVLVIEADDAECEIIEAIGFSPLRSRIDGHRNQPDWDWIEQHLGWWELLYTVGNAGFAYILLAEDSDTSPLARLCRGWGEGAAQ